MDEAGGAEGRREIDLKNSRATEDSGGRQNGAGVACLVHQWLRVFQRELQVLGDDTVSDGTGFGLAADVDEGAAVIKRGADGGLTPRLKKTSTQIPHNYFTRHKSICAS